MSIKAMIPSLNEAVKIIVVVTILAITGIGTMIITKMGGIFGRR